VQCRWVARGQAPGLGAPIVLIRIVGPLRQQSAAAPGPHTDSQAGLMLLQVDDGAGNNVQRLLAKGAVVQEELGRPLCQAVDVLLLSTRYAQSGHIKNLHAIHGG